MDGRFREKTAPAALPVTLERAKAHLHELADDQDTLIEEQYLPAAVQHCEDYMRRALVERTYEMVLDDFPRYWHQGNALGIRLPRPPLRSVESIEYKDTDGAWQTLDPTDYQVDDYSEPAEIVVAAGECWPETECGGINNVRIEFKAGYAPGTGSPVDYAENIPKAMISAILLVLSDLYQHREDVVTGTTAVEIPLSAQRLMNPYRVWPV